MASQTREGLTTKPILVIFTIVATVVSVGYVLVLAVLAPEQLAEASYHTCYRLDMQWMCWNF
jgi:hypothetical protein